MEAAEDMAAGMEEAMEASEAMEAGMEAGTGVTGVAMEVEMLEENVEEVMGIGVTEVGMGIGDGKKEAMGGTVEDMEDMRAMEVITGMVGILQITVMDCIATLMATDRITLPLIIAFTLHQLMGPAMPFRAIILAMFLRLRMQTKKSLNLVIL